MTFQQLHYLLHVAECGSISKAAEKLFVSRPSISISINSLEGELGYPIFIRNRQGFTLTKEGVRFLDYARSICDTHKLMTNIIPEPQYRNININLFDHTPVNRAATRLLAAYPNRADVRFSFCIYSINEILQKLATNELDVAVFSRLSDMTLRIEQMIEKRNLESKVLGTVQTVLYIGPGHRYYDKPDLTLRDLETDNFLDTPYRELSKNVILKIRANIPPECVIPCNCPGAKMEMIRQGLGYTIGKLPIKPIIELYGLRCIPIPELEQPIFCAYNPKHEMPPEAARFIALVEEEIAQYNFEQ